MPSVTPRHSRPRPISLACWLCLLATAALAALLAGMDTARAADTVAEARAHATALSTAFREAAAAASPSVVLVRSEVKPAREQARDTSGAAGAAAGPIPSRARRSRRCFATACPRASSSTCRNAARDRAWAPA